MNILFLTDSLGYPRVDGHGSKASDTWTYAVRNELIGNHEKYRFYFDMKGFRTTSSIIEEMSKHLLVYEPDVVVLQVGIVDCYPRALTRLESQILSRIPILNQITKNFVKLFYKRIIKFRNITYTSQRDFKNNLIKLKSFFPKTNWIVVPIAPASDAYKKRNPLVELKINSFNEELKSEFPDAYLSETYNIDEINSIFLEDNHHLSKYGHSLVKESVVKELSKFNLDI